MNATQQQLALARDLVAAGWTQTASARDEFDYRVSPFDARAVRWDPIGALSLAAGDKARLRDAGPAVHTLAKCVRPELRKQNGGISYRAALHDTYAIRVWNDAASRTQDEVVAMFNRAIEEAVKK